MPINVYWDNEQKTILRADFIADWTWEEYKQAVQVSYEMGEELEHYFVQINDFRQSNAFEVRFAISNIIAGRRITPKHLGITIIVGAESILKVILSVIERTSHRPSQKRYLVNTLEEGYKLIAEHFAERSKNAKED